MSSWVVKKQAKRQKLAVVRVMGYLQAEDIRQQDKAVRESKWLADQLEDIEGQMAECEDS